MDGEAGVSGLAKIRPALQSVVDAGDLSGFVTLIWKKGEILQVEAVGHRDIEAGAPMQRDTLFRIASMTKPATSVLALMLMEEGRLSLSDPITKWLPEFNGMKVLKSATGPLGETYDALRDITVEDLLTHRSGLAYGFTSIGPIGQAHEDTVGPPLDNPLTPDEWVAKLASLPLSYPPGERFHYSHSTEVLGFLLGRVAGKTYREALIEKVLAPLGMSDTDFWVPAEKRHRLAKMYRIDEATDRLAHVPFPDYDAPPAYCAGGGGLISTVDDYLVFARMLLAGGEADGVRLLKPETVELMRTNRLTDAQRQIPFLGLPFWMGQGFGLGVSLVTDPEKQAWMGVGGKGAFGWPGAFGTWWQADPEKDVILIYMIQNSVPLTPDVASQLATGQRMGARAALPMFQKLAMAALGG